MLSNGTARRIARVKIMFSDFISFTQKEKIDKCDLVCQDLEEKKCIFKKLSCFLLHFKNFENNLNTSRTKKVGGQ